MQEHVEQTAWARMVIFIALSWCVRRATALIIKREVKRRRYCAWIYSWSIGYFARKAQRHLYVIEIDENYKPVELETKMVYGVTFEQGRNEIQLNGEELFAKYSYKE